MNRYDFHTCQYVFLITSIPLTHTIDRKSYDYIPMKVYFLLNNPECKGYSLKPGRVLSVVRESCRYTNMYSNYKNSELSKIRYYSI